MFKEILSLQSENEDIVLCIEFLYKQFTYK